MSNKPSLDASRDPQCRGTQLGLVDDGYDRYLLVEDYDDFTSDIRTLLAERSPRGLQVLS